MRLAVLWKVLCDNFPPTLHNIFTERARRHDSMMRAFLGAESKLGDINFKMAQKLGIAHGYVLRYPTATCVYICPHLGSGRRAVPPQVGVIATKSYGIASVSHRV
jgi:hypothetical protein